VLWAFALLIAVGGGCFDYVEELTLKPDGSGTLVMVYAVPEIVLMARGSIEEAQPAEAEKPSTGKIEESDEFLLLPRDEIRKEVEDANFRIRRIRGLRQNAVRILTIEGYFDDLTKVSKGKAFSANTFRIERTGETILFERRLSVAKTHVMSEDSSDEPATVGTVSPYESLCLKYGKDRLDSLLAGFSIQFTVIMPGDVTASNATTLKGDTAIWKFPLNTLVKRESITMWCRARTEGKGGP